MQHLEVSGAVQPIYGSLDIKRLIQYLKNYRYNQIYLRKIVSSHKSRTLNLDTKFWLKKCVNYASKYSIDIQANFPQPVDTAGSYQSRYKMCTVHTHCCLFT